MTAEQPDSAAETQAKIEVLADGLYKWAMAYRDQVIVPFAEAYGRVASMWLEQNRPLIEALNRAASGSRDAPGVPSGEANRTLSLVNTLRDQLIGN